LNALSYVHSASKVIITKTYAWKIHSLFTFLGQQFKNEKIIIIIAGPNQFTKTVLLHTQQINFTHSDFTLRLNSLWSVPETSFSKPHFNLRPNLCLAKEVSEHSALREMMRGHRAL
jgi:hypothetical protein